MPIKFRCNYCRQFLGISRAQAGGIVDCPTCGRSIRVPLLDGSLPPLPQPELNLQDAQLTRALDELARLGNSDSSPMPVTFETAADPDEEDENGIPQLIPEPIPIEVPIPPTPIAINPPMQDDDEVQTLESPQSHAASSPSIKYDVLAELAAVAPAESHPPKTEPVRSVESRPQRDLGTLPRTLLLVAIAFVAGMLFERFVKVFESRGPSFEKDSAPGPSKDAKAAAVSQVSGRITYKSGDGTSQPDRGAKVIAFPVQREGEAKLSVIGFRPADGEPDALVATAALRALGGAVATADDSGQFHLELPAGTYQLLILSHFQSRDEQQPPDPALQKLLATYFDKPDDVLGRVKYDFSPLRVKGTGDVRDQSF